MSMRLNLKLLIFFELVLLVAVLALIIPVRTRMRAQVVEDMQRELRAVAATGALLIDGDLHKTIHTRDDANGAAFARLRDVLLHVRQSNEGLTQDHIYTFFRDGDQVRFAVMTHPMPFVGDPYKLQPAMMPVWDRGEVSATDLYTDQNGSWISAYAPIKDSSGAVVGLLEVDKNSAAYFAKYHEVNQLNIIVGLVALGISSVVGWSVLDWIVIRPMRAVREGVRALSRQDFLHRVKLKTRDEFEELGDALNHVSQQLNAARSVQASFIPKSLPRQAGYDIAIWTEPCDATAGDYVDAFALGNDRIAVLVADVTGHGLGPSLLMAACRSSLRALTSTSLTPAEVIHRLDMLLRDDLEGGRFITMIFGILDADGTFTFCNAGHGPALVATADGIRRLEAHRPPLGIGWDVDGDAEQTKIQLMRGDRILFASDGVNEAFSPAGEQFGYEPIEKIIADRSLSCEDVIRAHRDALQRHCGGRSKTDDVTILCVDRVIDDRVVAGVTSLKC